MMLYCLGHLLFLASFLALRVQQPHAPRAFRVFGGLGTAGALSLIPVAVCFATIGINVRDDVSKAVWFAAVLLLGLVVHGAWLLVRGHRARWRGMCELDG